MSLAAGVGSLCKVRGPGRFAALGCEVLLLGDSGLWYMRSGIRTFCQQHSHAPFGGVTNAVAALRRLRDDGVVE